MLAPSHDKHLTKPSRARPACRGSIASRRVDDKLPASEAGGRLSYPVEVSRAQVQNAEPGMPGGALDGA